MRREEDRSPFSESSGPVTRHSEAKKCPSGAGSGEAFGVVEDSGQIQNAYERAFARAGVPFNGTHSLRHGGCNLVYNQTGDMAVASQILGNEDPDTVKVYAKPDARALQDVSNRAWEASRAVATE
jgi:integrase